MHAANSNVQFNSGSYGRQYINKTLYVHPEAEGLRAFIKQYTDLMIAPILNFWESKTSKAPETCELPPASPTPSKYKSIQIAAIRAAYNLFDKSDG